MTRITSSTLHYAILFIIFVDYLCSGLVIYRRKPKPKLVCHEEFVDDEITQSGSPLSSSILAASSSLDGDTVTTKKPTQKQSSHRHSMSHNGRDKREVETDVASVTSRSTAHSSTASHNSNEPVIRLGTADDGVDIGTTDVDDVGGFEIVGENLTAAEKAIIRRKLAHTCHALNLN